LADRFTGMVLPTIGLHLNSIPYLPSNSEVKDNKDNPNKCIYIKPIKEKE
jgi:hypothetical protein